MHTHRLAIVTLALAGMLGGCNSFDKDYEAAVAAQSTASYTDVTGAWVGEWRSEADDSHSGAMRAIITQVGDGVYRARYEAKWQKIMTFHTEVELREVNRGGGEFQEFLGSEDLGMIWGVYHYKAKATRTQFNSTYRSEKDHGVYQLKRP